MANELYQIIQNFPEKNHDIQLSNFVMKSLQSGEVWLILLEAKEDIPAGAQLGFDYGHEYWYEAYEKHGIVPQFFKKSGEIVDEHSKDKAMDYFRSYVSLIKRVQRLDNTVRMVEKKARNFDAEKTPDSYYKAATLWRGLSKMHSQLHYKTSPVIQLSEGHHYAIHEKVIKCLKKAEKSFTNAGSKHNHEAAACTRDVSLIIQASSKEVLKQ